MAFRLRPASRLYFVLPEQEMGFYAVVKHVPYFQKLHLLDPEIHHHTSGDSLDYLILHHHGGDDGYVSSQLRKHETPRESIIC